MNVCRVCLSKKPEIHLHQLATGIKDDPVCYLDIFSFCLDIRVKENSKISSKLCSKCCKKLNTFYKFKTMALKNDAYLNSLTPLNQENDIKMEPLHEDEVFVESVTINDDDCFTKVKTELKEDYESPIINKQKSIEEESSGFEKNEEESHTIESEDNGHNGANTLSVNKNAENITTKLLRPKPEKGKNLDQFKTKSKKAAKKGDQYKSKAKNADKKGPGVCDQCGASVRSLKEHSLKHIPRHQRKQYPCKLCDKIYIEPSALRRHHKRKHLGILSHCDICNKDVTSLRNHQLVKHNRDTLPLQCSVCELRFQTPSSLNLHLTLHTDEKAFQCHYCGKNFRLKLMLDSHVRMVHHKEKNYLCTICTKGFFKKVSLDIHVRTHTKEKPCKCTECGKSFACPSTLRNHMRCHSDVKAYRCDQCDKSFTRASTLYMHKRAHRQEKPYSCRHCDARYARTFDRNRHERNHHPDKKPADNTDITIPQAQGVT